MDDLDACADLCESHGFAAPAAALRALAGGGAPFFLVRALLQWDDHRDEFDPADILPPTRKLFRDRASAEAHARTLTARALRSYRPDLSYGPPAGRSAKEFVRDAGAILGSPYALPADGGLLFPESATDQQLGRLASLLYFTLFDVAEFAESPAEES